MSVPRLFVIEAPGKSRQLAETLRKAGEDARVVATVGHLFNMDEKLTPVGIDRDFRDFGRKPRDVGILERIRREALPVEEVIVATDADQEGDVIAWDVHTVLRDMGKPLLRMRLRGMDQGSIREALDDLRPVRKEDAVPGRTRAIVDRLIGAGFSGGGVAVGRVGTALLGLVASGKPGALRLRLVAPAREGGRPYTAECEVKAPLDEATADRLAALSFPTLGSNGPRRPVERKPGHMGDVMVRCADKMGISPKETAGSMQRLYELGRMSYPRAGARAFSAETAIKVAAILRKNGYDVNGQAFSKKEATEVHDAPYPIGKVELDGDVDAMGQDEGVRTTIARELVRVGQKHFEEHAVGGPLVGFLLGKGFHVDVATFVAELPWRRESGPAYPGKESWPESEVTRRRVDAVLLEKAVEANLGRPSTWAGHVDGFVNRGLVDQDMALTSKGREWVDRSPAELLDPRVSTAIEKACERFPPSMMEDADREPWELNAARIAAALPPVVQERVMGLVSGEGPHVKFDPVEAYGLDRSFVAEAEELAAAPAYAPRTRD